MKRCFLWAGSLALLLSVCGCSVRPPIGGWISEEAGVQNYLSVYADGTCFAVSTKKRSGKDIIEDVAIGRFRGMRLAVWSVAWPASGFEAPDAWRWRIVEGSSGRELLLEAGEETVRFGSAGDNPTAWRALVVGEIE